MLIGILETETLPAQVQEQFGSYGDMFANLLQPLNDQLSFRYYAADQAELPQNTAECDAYVITGSRHNAYDADPWIEALREFVRQLDAQQSKCLGICFGHQLIAEALGGKVARSEKGWGIGLSKFTVGDRPRWMRDLTGQFNVLVSHQDQVERLPSSASPFAYSEFCPNGGYFIGTHIFCLQGHPEFNKDYVRFLISKRRQRIGETEADRALHTLASPVDSQLLQHWLQAFFAA